jgi:hypothetical protein
MPRYAAAARSWLTGAPPSTAGSARIGSASVVPSWRSVEVPNAAVASPEESMPARRSMETEKAVAVAPPPGRILPTTFPLNCAVATGNQARVRRAIRSSSQRQTTLAVSKTSTRSANGHSTCSRARQEEATASRLGRNT